MFPCFLSVANSTHAILKGVQLNNKTLAVALQVEKEKVRQANAVILQLKREQQALFLHLLLLKRKLKEQEALAVHASAVIHRRPVICVIVELTTADMQWILKYLMRLDREKCDFFCVAVG